ncbi:hypothetical protein [Candidatus Pantoea multigeneris]|nr:hypothetical protein [Pantoea multigeneris]
MAIISHSSAAAALATHAYLFSHSFPQPALSTETWRPLKDVF